MFRKLRMLSHTSCKMVAGLLQKMASSLKGKADFEKPGKAPESHFK